MSRRFTHKSNRFRYFNSSPGVIRLVVMKCVRFLLNQRNFEGLLFERDLDICRETMKCSSSSTASDITCGVRLTMRESQLVAILRGAKSAFARIKALGPA